MTADNTLTLGELTQQLVELLGRGIDPITPVKLESPVPENGEFNSTTALARVRVSDEINGFRTVRLVQGR